MTCGEGNINLAELNRTMLLYVQCDCTYTVPVTRSARQFLVK